MVADEHQDAIVVDIDKFLDLGPPSLEGLCPIPPHLNKLLQTATRSRCQRATVGLELKLSVKERRHCFEALRCASGVREMLVSSVPEGRATLFTISTFSCDIAYSQSPAASRASASSWG